MKCKYCPISIEDKKIFKKHEKVHKQMGDELLELEDEERTWSAKDRNEIEELRKKADKERKTRKKRNSHEVEVKLIKAELPPPKWDTINILQTKDGIKYVPCPHCGGALIINIKSEESTIEHMEVMSDFMDYLFRGQESPAGNINS